MEEETAMTVDEAVQLMEQGLDFVWLFVCLVLVVIMQPAFAAYEVGRVSGRNNSLILFVRCAIFFAVLPPHSRVRVSILVCCMRGLLLLLSLQS